MTRRLRVLLVEDNPRDAAIAEELLARSTAALFEVERAARQLKRRQRKWWRHHRRSGERASARRRQARLHTLEMARRHETRQARIAGRTPYPVGQRSADERRGGDDRRKYPEDLAMPC